MVKSGGGEKPGTKAEGHSAGASHPPHHPSIHLHRHGGQNDSHFVVSTTAINDCNDHMIVSHIIHPSSYHPIILSSYHHPPRHHQWRMIVHTYRVTRSSILHMCPRYVHYSLLVLTTHARTTFMKSIVLCVVYICIFVVPFDRSAGYQSIGGNVRPFVRPVIWCYL